MDYAATPTQRLKQPLRITPERSRISRKLFVQQPQEREREQLVV